MPDLTAKIGGKGGGTLWLLVAGDIDSTTTRRRTVNSVSTSTPTVDSWCHITYHQYRDHVGTPGCSLPVHTDTVHVFSGLHHGAQGLCLSALRPAAAAGNVSQVIFNSDLLRFFLIHDIFFANIQIFTITKT